MAKGKYEKWMTEEGLTILEGWARNGLTDDQIAHNMGIRRETLYEWKKKYPNISNALKKGKEVVDTLVENALLKRALGYSFEETRIETNPDGSKKVVRTVKEVVPDTTAQIFWLKNRRPDIWRAKPEPNYKEEYEDDGLMTALSASVDRDMFDDTDTLPEED